MEPVGFSVGALGLVGAFAACVDCFEYIQLGRQFRQDYGKCLLKIDAAKVRMFARERSWDSVQSHMQSDQFQRLTKR